MAILLFERRIISYGDMPAYKLRTVLTLAH